MFNTNEEMINLPSVVRLATESPVHYGRPTIGVLRLLLSVGVVLTAFLA